MKRLAGIPASRGICIGPVFQFIRQELVVTDCKVDDPQKEIERLNAAIGAAKEQISKIYEKALTEASKADAEIFQAHLMILEDPEMLSEVRKKIESRNCSAETAMKETAQAFSDMMAAMKDEYFAARATDILDVGNRVLRILMGVAESPTANLKTPSVIVADDLTPSDTVLLDKSLVIGFCTARGSATSHTAILARGLGIPAVAGVGETILSSCNASQIILDGTNGEALLDPDQAMVKDYEQRIQTARTIREASVKHAHEPAVTIDGRHLEVVSNIGNVEGARSSIENGAEGVGLLRSEFVFLWQDGPPAQQQPIDLVVEVRAVTPDNRRGPPAQLRIAAPPGS